MATDTLEFKLVMRPAKMNFAVADAHRDGRRFVVSADEILTAFVELGIGDSWRTLNRRCLFAARQPKYYFVLAMWRAKRQNPAKSFWVPPHEHRHTRQHVVARPYLPVRCSVALG